MKTAKIGFLAVLAIAACATMASAAVDVRVDFNDAAGTPAGNWNVVAAPDSSSSDLIDYQTGVGSGVDLAVAGGSDSTGTGHWDTSNAGPAWLDAAKDAPSDYFWSHLLGGGDIVVTLSGLNDNVAYDVELVSSANSTSGNQTATYTIGGNPFDGSTDGRWNALTDGYTNGGWMVWSDVTPTGGQIVLTVTHLTDDDRSRLSALRLTEVPEPATLGLLGLGGLGLLRRRRA